MPDIPSLGSAASAAASVYGLNLVRQVIGPSAKTLGQALDRYTEYRTRNVGRIGEKAARKLGGQIDEPGEVHPRVAHRILDEGSWCDDDLTQEYLAGILVAARQAEAADDRGATWADVVASLSAYQIRTHYIVYRTLRDLGQEAEPKPSLHQQGGRGQNRVIMSIFGYAAAMGFGDDFGRAMAAATHAVPTLVREGFLGIDWHTGQTRDFDGVPHPTIKAESTFPGAELFLWAHGIEMLNIDQVFTEPEERFAMQDRPVPVQLAILGS